MPAQEFRAYLIGPDDHIIQRIDLFCDSEDDARQRAQQLVDGHAVELWQGTRRIAVLEPKH